MCLIYVPKTDRESLSYKELIQLQAEPLFDEETEPFVTANIKKCIDFPISNKEWTSPFKTILTTNVVLVFSRNFRSH